MKKTSSFKKQVLVVVAHPDDEVLGCGGTIVKFVQEGAHVSCLILGKGKASRFRKGDQRQSSQEQAVLKKEAEKAARILGISELLFGDFPDQKYDTVPFLEIVQAIEKAKEKVKPDIIFTHDSGDINLDHQIVHRAVLTACRPTEGETVNEIYAFTIPAATEWAATFSFAPDVFVDIEKTFKNKLRAMEAYQSELRIYPHPRSLGSLEIAASYWGTIVGKKLVEPFELVRKIQ